MSDIEARAELDGTLALFHVEHGAQVDAGEPIAEIECMKVMFRVLAPASGIVRYRYALGEFVGHGDVIATVEPMPNGK